MSIMRSNLLGCLSVVALCGAAHAATIVPVAPVPNSIATNAFGINDTNTIAGAYTDTSGLEHAFFGSPNGKYTTFDSGSGGTEARAINNNAFITGFSNSSAHDTSQQPIFERLANGKIVPVTYHRQQVFGQAQGLGNDNRFAGTYWDFVNSESDAFVGRKGRFLHTIFFSVRRQGSTGEAINSNGTVVGWFNGPPGHGFMQNGKITTVVDYPSAVGTSLEGINDSGQAAGQWTDTNFNMHAFLLDIGNSKFTDIVVPGATNVAAWGINNNAVVAVSTDIGSFIWCRKAHSCPKGGTVVDAPVHVATKPFPKIGL